MIPGAKYILDLPVYRLEEDDYYRQREAFVERTMIPEGREDTEFLRQHYAKNRDADARIRDHLARIYGGAWPYNEIIGFIQLHVFGTQIRGEYWGVDAKHIVRTRRKVFKWRTWKLAPEMDLPRNGSDAEIFGVIRAYVERCRCELPTRVIDASALSGLGPHVRWNDWLRDGSTFGAPPSPAPKAFKRRPASTKRPRKA